MTAETALPSVTATWSDQLTGAQALHLFAPAAGAILDQLCCTVADRPDRVALVRWACASAQELRPLRPPSSAAPLAAAVTDRRWSTLPPADQTVLRFAEQFSLDVSALDDGLRADLWSVLDETPRVASGRLLAMTWVADLVPRVRTTLDRLFTPSGPAELEGADEIVDSASPLGHEFVRVVHTLHELDPILSDVVRLRGAYAHNCRLCKSLRSRTALLAGAADSDFDVAGDLRPSQLPAPSRAALALVDAMLWHPARVPEPVLTDVREHFTPAQAVEIVLDVMRNAWNKTAVAAVLDEAHVTEGTEVYEYHDDGSIEFRLTAPSR